MDKIIPITCEGADMIDVRKFTPLQGDLKEKTIEQLTKLKNLILSDMGFSFPMFVWKKNGTLFTMDGHGRDYTCRELLNDGYLFQQYDLDKWKPVGEPSTKVPVDYIGAKDRRQAKKKLLALNASFGNKTEEGLYNFINEPNYEIDDFELFSQNLEFNDVKIDEFIHGWLRDEKEEETDVEQLIDKAEELQKKWQVKEGDLWKLGRHLLLCGDALNGWQFKEMPQMIYTDPPYGKGGYAGRSGKLKAIRNDNKNPKQFYDIIPKVDERYLWGDFKILRMLDNDPRDVIVWKKNNISMGRGYRGQYELLMYYGKFSGSDSDLWEARKIISDVHPTEKPIELAIRAINNSTRFNELVGDLYLGVGNTLIACEAVGRICNAIEIEPSYCAVTLERWSLYTGQMPKRIS